MKKTYTSAFKAKLVLELLKGDKSLTQLASDYKVHPNQLRNWRDLALHDFASLFDKKNLAADHVSRSRASSRRILRPDRQTDHPGQLAEKKSGLDPDRQ